MTLRILIISCGIFLCSTLALSQSKWELTKDVDGMKVWQADTQLSDFKTYKTEMTISADLEKVKNLLTNLDSIAVFFDGISCTADVKDISKNEVQCSLQFDYPWLKSKRKVYVTQQVFPVETGSYEISINTFSASNLIRENTVLKKMMCLWIITNAGIDQTYIKQIIHQDLNFSIPSSHVNTLFTNSHLKTFHTIRNLLE